MKLITSKNHPIIDLLKQHGVTDVYCSLSDSITIHLGCNEGEEQIVFNNLPKWIHEEMIVTKSDCHVFLEAKQ